MKKKVLIIILICLAAIVAISAGLWIHEKNTARDSLSMPEGTIVNGIDVSGMNKQDAKDLLVKKMNKQDFRIKGDVEYTLPMDGTKYKVLESLDNCVADQGFFKYIGHLFGKKYDVKIPMTVSKTTDAFKASLKSFIDSENEGKTMTKNAYVDLSTTDFKVVAEIYGDSIDKKKLKEDILDTISDGKHELSFSHDSYIDVPEITKDSQKIQDKLDYCNKYLAAKISYEFGDRTITLTPKQLDKMIVVKNGEVKVKKDNTKKYIADMAAKYDTYYMSRSFETTSGRTVTLRPGTYGYIIDQDAEYKQLLKDIKGCKDVSREPVYARTGNGRQGVDDILGDYVEVDLTNQHVYVYRNGSKVVDSPCVSGCLKPDKVGDVHGTVCGVFTIAYKEKDATLKGGNEADETDYESEVKYWMPFFNGIGLHDADWRAPDQFGGNIYKTNGSHGCINLPVPKAEKIFNNVNAGTIVVVFY